MKLIVQPGDGVERLSRGIRKAKSEIRIVIFRFDRGDLERALIDAAERGIFVHALIAFTNRGGEENLRKLEMHLLDKGITVARTADDLVRYHGKMMIVDRKELYLLAFNFTHLDIDHSRSFGLITRNPKLVQEALKLFEADSKRQEYVSGNAKFIVSPVNARNELVAFLKGATKELLIYDPKISDRAMLRILDERKAAGVNVRIIGEVSGGRLPSRELSTLRLHTRLIIRDCKHAFLGSQSLRQLELDARREIGIIFRDAAVIRTMGRIFEDDWAASKSAEVRPAKILALPPGKTAKKVAKILSENLSVAPVVAQVVKSIKQNGGAKGREELAEVVETAVREAVKDSVKEATRDVVKAAVAEAVALADE